MAKKLLNYLRMHRRHAGLYQEDIAFLIGKSSSSVSDHETFISPPDLKTVLAYRSVFGSSVASLFPGEYEKVEDKVRQRARKLIKIIELEQDTPAKKERLDALTLIAEGISEERESKTCEENTKPIEGK